MMLETAQRKKFTILHSNDIHGDFQAEVVQGAGGKMLGGLARLSGYINQVRQQEKNVLYSVCLQDYFYNSAETKLGLSQSELAAQGTAVVAPSIVDLVLEYLRNHQNLNSQVEGRIVFR